MTKRVQKHGQSFHYAWQGLKWVFVNEANFQLQVIIMVLVLGLAYLLRVEPVGISLLLFASCFVLICEMINTSLEKVVDLATEEWRIKAKIAKDVAAGMSLLSAICAAGVGIIVFYPYILKLI